MTDAGRRRLAWALWLATILAYVVEVALLFANTDLPVTDPVDEVSPWIQALEDFSFVAVGTLGLRILLTQPGNAVGWWIMVIGLSFPLEGLAVEFARFGMDRWGDIPIVAFSTWVWVWVWIFATFGFAFILLLYPNGHPPSPRWRPVLWFNVVAMAIALVALMFLESGGVQQSFVFWVVLPSQLGTVLVGLLSLVARYRSSAGVERQQVKVLLWVGVVGIFFFGWTTLVGSEDVWIESVINFVFTIFVGAAITLAILRYRLFEIDRLFSRTVTYAVLAATLALVYAFGAVWLPSRIVGEQTPLFVAGSTLAVAALFNPLRRRVMQWVDRRFNRSSYDLQQITDRFAAHLRDQVDADQLAADWAGMVTTTLQPAGVGVWVRDQAAR